MSTRRVRLASAVAAVAVLLTGCAGGPEESAAPPREASPTSPPSTPPAGPGAWVDSLPVGPPPRIGYVIGHTYHSADGRVVRLPRDRGITWIAGLGDGFLMVDDRGWEGTAGISVLDARGHRTSDVDTIAGTPVLSKDGATLRWITFTPAEVGPSGREPTRLHLADVATGEIETQAVRRDVDGLPRVPQSEGQPTIDTHRKRGLRVVDSLTGAPLARLESPGRWVRGLLTAAAWERPARLLVAAVDRRTDAAAILRVDLESGAWELAVDWTRMEETSSVTFETRR